jgi:hypothetical protein
VKLEWAQSAGFGGNSGLHLPSPCMLLLALTSGVPIILLEVTFDPPEADAGWHPMLSYQGANVAEWLDDTLSN